MALVNMVKPETIDDPQMKAIFDWVAELEGEVPNHFYVEMNFPEYFKARMASVQILWQQGELSMPEILHVGIATSKAIGCPYCTAAFCTVLNYGLQTDEEYVKQFVTAGADAVDDERLKVIVEFTVKSAVTPAEVTKEDVDALRRVGLTDKGIVQLINLVNDFSAYNRLNLALKTDYDYRDMWRQLAFGWQKKAGEPEGDNTRGVR